MVAWPCWPVCQQLPSGVEHNRMYFVSGLSNKSFFIHQLFASVIGFLVTEEPIGFHPLFDVGAKDIGPAIRHLDEVRAAAPFFFEILAVAIGALELRRALLGWEVNTAQNLKDDYYPGDIGFDPLGTKCYCCVLYDAHYVFFAHSLLFLTRLGLKPSDQEDFDRMATKELQNGRLAMLGAMGFILQELVNGKEIFCQSRCCRG